MLSAKLLQLCPTLCDPMDCSPPGTSVHGILQARTLGWAAVPSSSDLPNPGIKPVSLTSPALAGRLFTISGTHNAAKDLLKPQQGTDSILDQPYNGIYTANEKTRVNMHVLKRKTLKHHYEKKGMNRVNNFVLTGLKKKQYLYTLNHI